MKENIDINRANYETYVIDYLDGKLDTIEIKCFISFLESNPDIKEEIESINEVSLVADQRVFVEKNNLKKEPVTAVNSINEINYEEFFIANYENDLSESETKSLKQFLIKNPNLNQEFDIHSKLKLSPVEAIVYSDKNKLKQKVNLKPVWYSVAAALILLFSSYWFLYNLQPSSVKERITNVIQIFPKEISGTLSSRTLVQIVSQERQLSVIPVSDNDLLVDDNEEILLAYVESKSIDIQLVNVYDYARVVEYKNTGLITASSDIVDSEVINIPISNKNDKSLFASVFNNQIKKIGYKLGIGKKKSRNSNDPTYIELIDKGLTVFNTITGSETSTVKTYNSDGELTSYQVEGREVLLGKNQTSKLSQ